PPDLSEADGYDKVLVDTHKWYKTKISELSKKFEESVAPLKQHFEQYQERQREEAATQFTKEVDDALNTLTTHADLFGTGDHTTIQDEKIRAERSKIW